MGSLIVFLGFLLSPPQSNSAVSAIHFQEMGRGAGLTAVPHSASEKRYLVEMMGGGIGLFDCDGDGKLDIISVTDSTIDRYLQGGDLMVTLYHQDGGLHFTDITQVAGLTTKGWGMGIAIGDFNNDGLPDVYVTGYGHNVLYQNLGGCRFKDVTGKANLEGGGFSVGAAWGDYDRDGKIDLFVSRYVDVDLHHLPKPGDSSFNYRGISMQIPAGAGETDFLFHNEGNGKFADVSKKAGVSNPDKRFGMGVVWGDYDNDGWPDLFVTNDMGPNFLYHNEHDGTFQDDGMLSGTALGEDGRTMGNMAADFGDYNRDRKLDLLVTRYGYQPLSLYRNQIPGGFADVTWSTEIGRLGYAPVRWGGGFADFDNDGWPDIFVANGNVTSLLDKLPHELKYREPIQLFQSQEGHTFREIGDIAGLNTGSLESRRGTAFGDINNDGQVDVVVYNVGAPPSIFLNVTHSLNHWVLFRLIGTQSNSAAIGARISVFTSKMTQIDEVRGGGSYLSSNDTRVHFGLALDRTMSRVVIQWPSGLQEVLKNVPGDAIYTIVEGKGIVNTMRLVPPGK